MNKVVKTVIWIVVVVIVVWLISAGMKSSPAQEGAKNESVNKGPIKIGFVGPLTGDMSSIGVPMRKAAQLAIDEVNEQGGINGQQVQFIAEDGRCTPAPASSAGQKLISVDKVTAIVGGACSGETAAFGPNAMQNKIVMVSPISSAPDLSKLGKYFFRDYPSDLFQGKFSAEYVYNVLAVRKVAILYSQSDWGSGVEKVFSERFKELGGSIVLEEGVAQEARDYRTEISKVKASKAELLYAPTYTEGATPLLAQIMNSGIKIKILGGDTWGDTKFQSAVSGSLGAMYVEVKTDVPQDFTTKFNSKYPEEKVSAGVPQAYDAAMIILNAIKKVGTNPDALADEIRSTNIQGVSGAISFDENGDIRSANYRVKKLLGNGKTEEVK